MPVLVLTVSFSSTVPWNNSLCEAYFSCCLTRSAQPTSQSTCCLSVHTCDGYYSQNNVTTSLFSLFTLQVWSKTYSILYKHDLKTYSIFTLFEAVCALVIYSWFAKFICYTDSIIYLSKISCIHYLSCDLQNLAPDKCSHTLEKVTDCRAFLATYVHTQTLLFTHWQWTATKLFNSFEKFE